MPDPQSHPQSPFQDEATPAAGQRPTVAVPPATLFDLQLASGETVTLEIMTVTTAAQELYARHGLKVEEGQVSYTAEFLEDLAAKIFGEDNDAGTTDAYVAWQTATRLFDDLKKKLDETLNSLIGIT